tara:strand:- start:1952 stop:2617 length:666 start_codon:yes stop_codon:yes gene_type:complete
MIYATAIMVAIMLNITLFTKRSPEKLVAIVETILGKVLSGHHDYLKIHLFESACNLRLAEFQHNTSIKELEVNGVRLTHESYKILVLYSLETSLSELIIKPRQSAFKFIDYINEKFLAPLNNVSYFDGMEAEVYNAITLRVVELIETNRDKLSDDFISYVIKNIEYINNKVKMRDKSLGLNFDLILSSGLRDVSFIEKEPYVANYDTLDLSKLNLASLPSA